MPKISLSVWFACFYAHLIVCAVVAQENGPEPIPHRWTPTRNVKARTSAAPNLTPRIRQASARAVDQIDDLPAPRRNAKSVIEIVKYRDAELPEALQLFVEQTGLNVIPSQKASVLRVSLYVTNVTPEQALAALARSNGMWYRLDRATGVYWLFTNEERAVDVLDPERLRMLEAEINEAFPDSYVKLALVGSQVVVRGQARDAVEAGQILRIVSLNVPPVEGEQPQNDSTVSLSQTSFLPNGTGLGINLGGMARQVLDDEQSQVGANIVNMLLIPGEQQVALRVTVAEVNRTAARNIGLNFQGKDDGGNVIFRSLVGGIMSVDEMGVLTSPGANFTTLLDNGQIELAIHALRQMNFARTLAEPTLTTLNGKAARFQAGGQFPVPVVSAATNAALQGVTYVPFGVQLEFTPNIVARDRLRLAIKAGVSERSTDLATNLGGDPKITGTQVAGLTNRDFETTVELKDGQTLAVAGLIRNTFSGKADRFPFFGDLPVVGRIAAYDRSNATEVELVILITPQLVRPIDSAASPPLPGSDVYEPGDVEFYLGAHMESQRATNYRSTVRTDYHRQKRYMHCEDAFIIGPSGYSFGARKPASSGQPE